MALRDSGTSGGGSTSDSSTESDSDSVESQSRRLRRDANSDPMREQTEPDRNSGPSSQSRSSSTVGGGGGGPQVRRPGGGGGSSSGGSRGSGSGSSGNGGSSAPTDQLGGMPVDAGAEPGGDRSGRGGSSAPTDRLGGQPVEAEPGTDPRPGVTDAEMERIRDRTPRANQSISFGTTGTPGAANPYESTEDIRRRTPRANQSVSFGTTGTPRMAAGNRSAAVQSRQSGVAYSDRNLMKEAVAAKVSKEQGQDYTADEVTVTRNEDGTVSFSVDQKETFDIDWSFGLGGEGDEVEQTVDATAGRIQSGIGTVSSGLFDETGATSNALGDDVLRALGQDELAESYDREIRNLGEGLYTGALSITNVPGMVGGVMEGNEVVAAAGGEVATSGDQEFVSKASTRGEALKDQAIDYAAENPWETTGVVAGSLVGSYGAMSTASRIGSRTGAATRYAIQPGEELAGAVGYRATKATAGTRAADRAFPNKEPLIFSEEAALRGGQRLVGAARRARSDEASASRVAREAAALRFKTAEALSPTVETRLDTSAPTRASRRLRQEATAARFKAAELADTDAPTRVAPRARAKASDVQTRASETFGSVRSRARDWASDTDRGQAQLPRLETRSRTRLEEPSIDTRQVTGPELDPDTTPRLDARSATRRFELALDGPESSSLERMEAAQRPAVDTRVGGLELETGREMTEVRSPVDLETESGTDLQMDVEIGTEIRTGLETELETDLETETEIETELEGETRRELEQIGERARRRRGSDPLGSLTASSTRLERDLRNPFTGE